MAGRSPRDLPIFQILPELLEVVPTQDVVIEAPPGAGKTTVVPLTLLEATPDEHGKIFVLQPRRLAARMSAVRVASSIDEPVGGRVGYRVRFDHVGSPQTRLWFMTEGILLRRLRRDPELDGVSTVVLDEFHERHLDGDLCLALLRRVQARRGSGDALRLIVMSATLDAEPVARFLSAKRLRAEGRTYPVEIEYRFKRGRTPADTPKIEGRVAGALAELVERGLVGAGAPLGHVLVFLPGAREIRACAERCAAIAKRAGLECMALHAQLPREQQDRAVFELGEGRSKLILSTNVAESAITIDKVVAVIDSGLARVADFDPGTGLPRLSLAPISRASATQRAGRAGRTRAGICVRLYGRHDHDHRPAHDLPEVRRLDLAGTLLELAAAGLELSPQLSTSGDFEWFETPGEASWTRARTLLARLGAIEEGSGELTATGRAMLRFPLHPRLARLVVAGVGAGIGGLTAAAAATCAERSLRAHDAPPPRTCQDDLLDEIDLLEGRGSRRFTDLRAQGRARQVAQQLTRLVKRSRASRSEADEVALRRALLAAHPDRVARVRLDEHDRRTLVFAFGGSAELSESSGVRNSEWVVALRTRERREGTRRRATVHTATEIDVEWLIDLFPDAIEEDEQVVFDPGKRRVLAQSSLRYGKLTIESSPLPRLPATAAAAVLFDAARAAGAERLCRSRDDEALARLRARANFLHSKRPAFPLLDETLVEATLERLCVGRSSFAELEQANLLSALEVELGIRAGDGSALDRLAPTRVLLPGGRRLSLHYETDRAPWVASRLQDFFGLAHGPTIMDGQEPVVLHLQAPNRHDVAVTTDLANFWREHYPSLRRQLSRRYPKHDWPEDPLKARPPSARGGGRGRGRRR